MRGDEAQRILALVVNHPCYQRNVEYGKPRPGHAEGTVRAHILELEQNLEELNRRGIVTFDHYWCLKLLIHTHDSFKAESKRNAAIEDPHSHASLARAFLADFTSDSDMLLILQYHDLGFAVYRKLIDSGMLAETRLSKGLQAIADLDLLVLFAITDGCTESKGREMIRWFVREVNRRCPWVLIKEDAILPGPARVGESW